MCRLKGLLVRMKCIYTERIELRDIHFKYHKVFGYFKEACVKGPCKIIQLSLSLILYEKYQ
jgi:hypothetical protein